MNDKIQDDENTSVPEKDFQSFEGNMSKNAEDNPASNERKNQNNRFDESKRDDGQEQSSDEAGQSDSAEPARRVIDENRPVRRKNSKDVSEKHEKEKNLRTMPVSEILHDEDWEDYDEEDLERPYHHHVRKQWQPREHRLWVRILKKLLIAAIVIGGFGAVFLYGFELKSVYVTGNYTYSDEEILNYLHYNEYPKNTLYFAWKNKNGITDGIPFVESINVKIKSPSVIYVTVKEKMIIGCIDDSGIYMFFDNTGAVVESSTSKPEDVPLVTGLDLSGLKIGDQLDLSDQSIFKNLYELSVYLKNYEVTVEQIDYNKDQSMVLHKGSISILLGMGTNLEDKISAYKDLEPYLEGLSGTLHLEDYDSTKGQINFSKE